jgi:hypothetical protein
MTAQNVQRSAFQREPEYKTTWAILVVRIVLDDLAVRKCLTDLLDAYVPDDALINRVL